MNPLVNNGNSQTPDNFRQAYTQVMQDPKNFLSRIGIPQNITSPQAAVQYLLQSGKVTQAQVEQAQKMAEQIQINQPIR